MGNAQRMNINEHKIACKWKSVGGIREWATPRDGDFDRDFQQFAEFCSSSCVPVFFLMPPQSSLCCVCVL